MNAKKIFHDRNQGNLTKKKTVIRLVKSDDFGMKRDSVVDRVINEKLIYPVYQSINQINSEKILAYEGLSRTKTSEFANIMELIDLANLEGKSGELDLLMMEECIRNFRGNGILLVNMEAKSPNQIEAYIERMVQVAKEVGMTANNLGIEISERNQWQAGGIEVLKKLRKKYNFVIAIDDFGVGYSNFALIRNLKPDIVKIDKSLVTYIDQDKEKYEFLKSVATFIREQNMKIIYEGIENIEELSALKRIGFGYGQGYYFEKPRRHY